MSPENTHKLMGFYMEMLVLGLRSQNEVRGSIDSLKFIEPEVLILGVIF